MRGCLPGTGRSRPETSPSRYVCCFGCKGRPGRPGAGRGACCIGYEHRERGGWWVAVARAVAALDALPWSLSGATATPKPAVPKCITIQPSTIHQTVPPSPTKAGGPPNNTPNKDHTSPSSIQLPVGPTHPRSTLSAGGCSGGGGKMANQKPPHRKKKIHPLNPAQSSSP